MRMRKIQDIFACEMLNGMLQYDDEIQESFFFSLLYVVTVRDTSYFLNSAEKVLEPKFKKSQETS
jgi:hypothetical protein